MKKEGIQTRRRKSKKSKSPKKDELIAQQLENKSKIQLFFFQDKIYINKLIFLLIDNNQFKGIVDSSKLTSKSMSTSATNTQLLLSASSNLSSKLNKSKFDLKSCVNKKSKGSPTNQLNGHMPSNFINSSNGSLMSGSNQSNEKLSLPINYGSSYLDSANPNYLSSYQQSTDTSYYAQNSLINGQYNYGPAYTQQQTYNMAPQSTGQNQYYYYPTPESSPDVQFQLLNDAAVLNAATQHLFANNSQFSNPINYSKRTNAVTQSTSSSPSSSTSPLSLSQQTFSQTTTNGQNMARQPTLTSPNQPNSYLNSYNNYSYPKSEFYECEKTSGSSDEPNKINNWYMAAAAAAAANNLPINSSNFLYSNEDTSLSLSSNSYSYPKF